MFPGKYHQNGGFSRAMLDYRSVHNKNPSRRRAISLGGCMAFGDGGYPEIAWIHLFSRCDCLSQHQNSWTRPGGLVCVESEDKGYERGYITNSSKLTWLAGKNHHPLLNIHIFTSNGCFFHWFSGVCISCNTVELLVFICFADGGQGALFFKHISLNLYTSRKWGDRRWNQFWAWFSQILGEEKNISYPPN